MIPLRQALKICGEALWGLMTMVIILGGILSGVFTANESAAMAVVWAFFVTMVIYRDYAGRDLPKLEQMRRLWAATEARALGYGGVSTVARAVGLTRPTITAGMKELGDARQLVPMAPNHRVRRAGAGRPRVVDIDAGLRPALEELVEPATRGHPMSPLRWTCKSVRTLAAGLTPQGHTVSHQTHTASCCSTTSGPRSSSPAASSRA